MRRTILVFVAIFVLMVMTGSLTFAQGPGDADGDGVPNPSDNCPTVANAGQVDTDSDGQGDACDPDDDNDGFPDGVDSCPKVAGTANGCPDNDGDGIANPNDNCPSTANGDQTDTDGDGQGDACDADDDNDGFADGSDSCPKVAGTANGCPDGDGDGISNGADNCPNDANSNQADVDGDGLGNVCDPDADNDGTANTADNCPLVFGTANGCPDDDKDGVANNVDNCVSVANGDQLDTDSDGDGDVCDTDDDGDGILDANDSCPLIKGNSTTPPGCLDGDKDGLADKVDNCPDDANPDQADSDGDGLGDACQRGILVESDGSTDEPIDDSQPDYDKDGIPDAEDSCPRLVNPGNFQRDTDGDGKGDVCDPEVFSDSDGDGIVDGDDLCPNEFGYGIYFGCFQDRDGDGVVDFYDRCQGEPGPRTDCGCQEAPPRTPLMPNGEYDCRARVLIIADNLEEDGLTDAEVAFIENNLSGNPAVDLRFSDEDEDGLIGSADECPTWAGTAEMNGCPPDSDEDGLPDSADKCPETAGDFNFSGCPDTDDDGIPDIIDECPEQQGTLKNGGCAPDSDGDGLDDLVDACPEEAGVEENQGCAAPPVCYRVLSTIYHENLVVGTQATFHIEEIRNPDTSPTFAGSIPTGVALSQDIIVPLEVGDFTEAVLYISGSYVLDDYENIPNLVVDLPEGITADATISRMGDIAQCDQPSVIQTFADPHDRTEVCYEVGLIMEANLLEVDSYNLYLRDQNTNQPLTDAMQVAINGTGDSNYTILLPGIKVDPDGVLGWRGWRSNPAAGKLNVDVWQIKEHDISLCGGVVVNDMLTTDSVDDIEAACGYSSSSSSDSLQITVKSTYINLSNGQLTLVGEDGSVGAWETIEIEGQTYYCETSGSTTASNIMVTPETNCTTEPPPDPKITFYSGIGEVEEDERFALCETNTGDEIECSNSQDYYCLEEDGTDYYRCEKPAANMCSTNTTSEVVELTIVNNLSNEGIDVYYNDKYCNGTQQGSINAKTTGVYSNVNVGESWSIYLKDGTLLQTVVLTESTTVEIGFDYSCNIVDPIRPADQQ